MKSKDKSQKLDVCVATAEKPRSLTPPPSATTNNPTAATVTYNTNFTFIFRCENVAINDSKVNQHTAPEATNGVNLWNAIVWCCKYFGGKL